MIGCRCPELRDCHFRCAKPFIPRGEKFLSVLNMRQTCRGRATFEQLGREVPSCHSPDLRLLGTLLDHEMLRELVDSCRGWLGRVAGWLVGRGCSFDWLINWCIHLWIDFYPSDSCTHKHDRIFRLEDLRLQCWFMILQAFKIEPLNAAIIVC